MNEKRLFADVDLPFHVWVRECGAAGPRWVLREATDLQQGACAPAANEPRRDASKAA